MSKLHNHGIKLKSFLVPIRNLQYNDLYTQIYLSGCFSYLSCPFFLNVIYNYDLHNTDILSCRI
jgi:hypothetical protein